MALTNLRCCPGNPDLIGALRYGLDPQLQPLRSAADQCIATTVTAAARTDSNQPNMWAVRLQLSSQPPFQPTSPLPPHGTDKFVLLAGLIGDCGTGWNEHNEHP